MSKNKLKPGFDPVWNSDFLDIKLKKLSKMAFIMRQMYRSYRNPENNTCSLSDLQIRNITGWDREFIAKARRQLIRLGEIIPTGYHSFAVKPFHQYQESCGENRQLQKTDLTVKPSTSCGENRQDLTVKPSTSCGENRQLQSHPDKTNTDKTESISASPVSKNETPESVSPESFLTPEGIKTLKMLCCDNLGLVKRTLGRMGITEAEADFALGRV